LFAVLILSRYLALQETVHCTELLWTLLVEFNGASLSIWSVADYELFAETK
jgi:hypothetical protein